MSKAEPRVRPDEPGTLAQQIAALAEFYGDEKRDVDRDLAWEKARIHVMPHARGLSDNGGRWPTMADNGGGGGS